MKRFVTRFLLPGLITAAAVGGAVVMVRSAGVEPESVMREYELPPPTLAHRTLTAWFRRLHAQGRAVVPHPQSTAMAFLGAIHARHMLRHLLGEHAPQTEPEFLHNLVDVFWAGIDPSRGAPAGSP